jgi:pre-mRNA-processing factor 6
MGDLARGQSEMTPSQVQQEQDRGDYSESNYDEFSGYGERLFAAGAYDEEDAEADRVYDVVDEMMDSRRKRSREQQLALEKKRAKTERPRIADQFADLKRELSTVSAEQWDAIPEVGDHSLKLKQSRKKETFMPVPDSVIEAAQRSTTAGSALMQSVDPSSIEASGAASVLSGSRGSALSSKLDRLSDSVSGQTVVDPTGYMTSLNSQKVTTAAEVGDIKQARALLQSVTSTNPKHGPGWIAAARVEEYAGKAPAARKIILEGCQQCPESEDVWLEAARLHPTDMAKTILANAVLQLPTSVKIWLRAADLETQEARKKAVLRRSLEFVPNAVNLWKAAIELENVTDARIMLARAVECVPHSVEMWLALAKLETHENARKVLNQARQAVPTERATWITAAKLEEANGNAHLVGRIVEKMVVSLAQYQVIISREAWIKEAEECEAVGAPVTCAAIIRNTVHLGLDPEDLVSTWMDDAETCLAQQPPALHTARAILAYALERFPGKKRLWQQAAMLEKEYGTAETLEARLREGVQACPRGEVLWLMYAKEKWLGGDVPGARDILLQAFQANPQSQQIWLAAVKLEWENDEFQRARILLQRAREAAPSERVWLKSALLEREVGQPQQALVLLEQAIKLYPTFAKFYMMAGQVCDEDLKEPKKAHSAYKAGLAALPSCIPLWRLLIGLVERVKGVTSARALGEEARHMLPADPDLWLVCIRLERRSGNEKLAENLMAKALQACPKAGVLWAEELLTCDKYKQKSRAKMALDACPDDPLVLVSVARLFDRLGRTRSAQKRLERALALNPKLGDAWAYLYCLLYVAAFREQLILAGRSVTGVGGQAGAGNSKGGLGQAEQQLLSDEEDDVEDSSNGNGHTPSNGNGAGAVATNGAPSSAAVSNTGGAANGDLQAHMEALDAVVRRTEAAAPNQGELWCATAKETRNRRLPAGAVLRLVAERILGYPPALHPARSAASVAGSNHKADPLAQQS